MEEEKKEAEARLEKMKNEMEGVFDQKVKEKISRLRESELNVCAFENKFMIYCPICWFEYVFSVVGKAAGGDEGFAGKGGT